MLMEEIDRRLLALFDELDRKRIDLHAFFDLVGGNTPTQQQEILAAVERLLNRGWLEAHGGDFYERTASGQNALAGLV